MSNTPNFDSKVKAILDATTPGERVCALTGEKWMMTEEEISWFRKFNVPPATWSPITRMKIIAAFATGFGWWWQKHPETGEKVLSYVHPATGIKVLPDPEFYEKDFTDRARDYDFTRPFNDQIRELQLQVPFTAWRSLTVPVNSIALLSQGDENSYFVTMSSSKNTMYSYGAEHTENSVEIYESQNIMNCYSVIFSQRLHKCKFIRQCFDIINCDFMFDCRNCENCFGASNKRNKKHLWFNEQLTPEEWQKRRATVDLGSRVTLDQYLQKFKEMLTKDTIWPENFNEKITNCTGELLQKSENITEGYYVDGSKNNYWVSYFFGNCENNAFTGGGKDSTNNYYCHAPIMSSGCKFVHSCYSCQRVEYSMQCYNSEDLFGCVGLNRKKFCIFNQQFTEAKYWQKLDEIKSNMLERNEYGDFFPLKFSPCYFFATPALPWLINEKDEKQLGAFMYDLDSNGARGEIDPNAPMIPVSELPDHVKVFSDLAGKAIKDQEEGKRFAYIKPEIALYQLLNIAPPLQNPMLRLRNLVLETNSAIPIEAICAKTGKKLRVAKNQNYPERKIYCREAYLEFIEQHG